MAKDIENLPEPMHEVWTKRKSRVVHKQLYIDCCAMFQPLKRILNLSTGKCGHCEEEDTVAYLIACPGRPRKRRANFTHRIAWRTGVLRKPLEVLGYLTREEESIFRLFGLEGN